MSVSEAKDRIIVALDVPSLEAAKPLVEALAPYVGMFKIGLQLITAEGGPRVVHAINEWGCGRQVFYDGKFNDIPNTVAGASKAVADMGVAMFNIHASSGDQAIQLAAQNKGDAILLGVTVLTSLDECECRLIFGHVPTTAVLCFASKLGQNGADGIICSPQELEALSHVNLLKVIPGIRPWADADDQKRIATPTKAIKAGADYLVIGRPILQPPPEIGSPVEAAKRIAEEIAKALV